MWIYIFDYKCVTEINTTLFINFQDCLRQALQLGRVFDSNGRIYEVSDNVSRQMVFESSNIKIFILKLTVEKSETS